MSTGFAGWIRLPAGSIERRVDQADEATPFIQFDCIMRHWSFRKGLLFRFLWFRREQTAGIGLAYGDGTIVSIAVPVEWTSPFLRLVNEKKQVHVFFRDGREKVWNIGLDGAGDALSKMLVCYKARRSAESGKSR